VTVLPAELEKEASNDSIVGLGEIFDEDLESGSRGIAELFHQSINRSTRELEE
jgi:hypothetical protein